MLKKKNFTLLELLITIGIIAILASILLPVLAKARTKGESASCIGNLRQLGMAVIQYAGDHDDIVVPIDNNNSDVFPWTAALMGTNSVSATQGAYLSLPLFRCVSVRTAVDMTGTLTSGEAWSKRGWWSRSPHYGMEWGGISIRQSLGRARKWGKIRNPSVKTFLCDTAQLKAAGGIKNESAGCYRWEDLYTGGNWPSNFAGWGSPVGRHAGGVNILHCDGSTGSVRLMIEDSCSVDPFRNDTVYTNWMK